MRDILADTSFHDSRMNFDSAATGALRCDESNLHMVGGIRVPCCLGEEVGDP